MDGSKISATIEGGDTITADQIVDIVLKEAAINLASHHTGPIYGSNFKETGGRSF